MALTGLEIYKHLPKKNCGECGPPTCLAFAMNLAAGKAQLDSCPYVSDEAKEALDSAAAPPIKLVEIGKDDKKVEIGDETELFRHEKKFFHPTLVAFKISDNDNVSDEIKKINENSTYERVGLEYKVELVAIESESGDPDKFKQAVETVKNEGNHAMILMSEDPEVIKAGLEVAKDENPMVYPATEENCEKMVELVKDGDLPLGVKGNNLEQTKDLVEKIHEAGHKNLVLDSGARETSQVVADMTQIRRQAVKKKFRPFGYPAIAFTTKEDPMKEIVQATSYVSKYAGIVVLQSAREKAEVLPLLSWRQNLYTDPQKPIQVEQKVGKVGEPDENSPVYITVNFSLAYYLVEGEVEESRIPSYILPVDTDGTSVLTAWAAGKFSPEAIAQAIKDSGLEDMVSHRQLVIPGHVAVLSGKLGEESGWEVVVGPREASEIPAFAKEKFK
ncbi:acetyl-CoA decarbonylase/synthase complex subunit gamma [Natranaerofaba carboxydovora]|uniref:acetyl-CoA decarbonylase/synthase complex subunit gamma n=1 Tax=Natranaerofaba carboxydovora TaxID=2742683 RepID=UPI001F137352|nr:acetyl-CoA decarbonylase/synthase complex subunit gamma [Natranaerofaba carboxydovora]UMZ75349.1 Corrinoid/iron-sulfur protein large subunit [Natranaerofaba carboxydovora]